MRWLLIACGYYLMDTTARDRGGYTTMNVSGMMGTITIRRFSIGFGRQKALYLIEWVVGQGV